MKGAIERELRWAAAVVAPFLALVVTLAVYGASQQLFGPFRVPGVAEALEVVLWLAIATAIPSAAVVALVLARAGWLRRGFANKGDRLGFHVLACLAGSGLLISTCDAAGTGAARGPNALLGALALAVVVFPLVYWPRVFASLSGLEQRAGAATPPSPRS